MFSWVPVIVTLLGLVACKDHTSSSSTGTGGQAGSGAAPPTSGAQGGSGTGVGGGGTGGSTGTGGAGTGGSGCDTSNCRDPLMCCGDHCVDPRNDPFNCGDCGERCGDDEPWCNQGECQTPPCETSGCGAALCCFDQCCEAGELCCNLVNGATVTACVQSVDGTCPRGHGLGLCLAPETLIATPEGPRPVAELRVGDSVYSVDQGQVVVVPIVRTSRTRVFDHGVLLVSFDNGESVAISPGHPMADGRRFSDMLPGERLGETRVTAIAEEAYHHAFTYDILPASDSGTYFAAGVLVGSTLSERLPMHERHPMREQ